MPRKIHVIINPASGQPQPVLHILNRVFRAAEADWDISITKKSGDAHRFAEEAAAAGADVVAANGGDGTVMEVARGLIGSSTPLAILPGGTANLMSVELGIPKDLALAAEIAAKSNNVRQVDVGQVGSTYFMLRVGMGFSALRVQKADRKLKDKYGIMAYTIAGLISMKESKPVNYRLIIDGQEVEAVGITCLVDNAGNMGVSGFSAAPNISVSDGLLDVIMIRDASFRSMVAITQDLAKVTPNPNSFYHWQVRQVTIEADPPQPVQIDGEMAGETPVTVKVVPNALRVLCPE